MKNNEIEMSTEQAARAKARAKVMAIERQLAQLRRNQSAVNAAREEFTTAQELLRDAEKAFSSAASAGAFRAADRHHNDLTEARALVEACRKALVEAQDKLHANASEKQLKQQLAKARGAERGAASLSQSPFAGLAYLQLAQSNPAA